MKFVFKKGDKVLINKRYPGVVKGHRIYGGNVYYDVSHKVRMPYSRKAGFYTRTVRDYYTASELRRDKS